MKNERVDTFRPHSGVVSVETPCDLLRAGITVHPNYVESRWGAEAAMYYQQAIAARIGPGRQTR